MRAIDDGSARILPLLKPRVALLPPDDALLPLIVGYYRRSLYHGRMLRARAATLLALFARAGIETMVSKGGVLGAAYYEDLGLRPMNDFDVLVPRERALDAVRVLLGAGWTGTQPMAEMLPDAYHSACFQSPDRLDFDLHWHLLPEACFAGADTPAWQAAERYTVDDVTTHAPCATDLLVVVCAHAAHWSPVSPARWVADALVILRRASDRIDWARIAMLAQRWHVVPHMSDTLSYLAQRWGADVPRPLLNELRQAAVGRIDRRAYALLGSMPGKPGVSQPALVPLSFAHARSLRAGRVARLPGLPENHPGPRTSGKRADRRGFPPIPPLARRPCPRQAITA